MTFSRIAEGGFPRNMLLILLLELNSTTSALKTRRVGKSVKKVLSTRAAVFLSFGFPNPRSEVAGKQFILFYASSAPCL